MASATLRARRTPLSLRPIGDERGFPMSTIAAGGLVPFPGAFTDPILPKQRRGGVGIPRVMSAGLGPTLSPPCS